MCGVTARQPDRFHASEEKSTAETAASYERGRVWRDRHHASIQQ